MGVEGQEVRVQPRRDAAPEDARQHLRSGGAAEVPEDANASGQRGRDGAGERGTGDHTWGLGGAGGGPVETGRLRCSTTGVRCRVLCAPVGGRRGG